MAIRTGRTDNEAKQLGQMPIGHRGRIVALGKTPSCRCAGGECDPIVNRLLELGMVEGSEVEILHQAAFGGDPIAIRVRGTVLALRRNEANHATVEELA